ncbi:hypothetical protein NLJ89_g8050 [Agrocybe chaxingu]|uniref:F-box domain-containing protein n=1 Tax=Agrocybe chaxingu TaxID=84603 RepID=A0A9W8MR57_9AGAR|nr:hypothetical protein NLJ89_g8050 [Agrocybe chaxingu]
MVVDNEKSEVEAGGEYVASEGQSNEGSSDEGSDYGTSRRKVGKASPAKKAKMFALSKKSPVKAGSRQKKTLSLLPTMPLDVLFEVFSHLSPKDIINVARTSRIFRETLMSKNATTSCGVKNIQTVDFGLLRRLCTTCKKAHFIVESKFKRRYPGVDSEVLELILYTHVGTWSHTKKSRFFWESDIDRMRDKLAEYESNVRRRRAGAVKALEDFRGQRKEMVKDAQEGIQERNDWFHDFLRGRSKDKQTLKAQRINAIHAKFLELGYLEEDQYSIRWQPECQQATLLSNQIWTRIRPSLEPIVMQDKRRRLERDTGAIRAGRRAIVHALYQEYKKTLRPSQWKCLPRTIDICAMEPFIKVLDADANVAVTAIHFEDAMRQLPRLLSSALARRKKDALASLKRHTSTLRRLRRRGQRRSPPPNPLDLATSAFICLESCRASSSVLGYGLYPPSSRLFGWDEVASHECRRDTYSDSPCKELDPRALKVSVHNSEVVTAIVQAVGLDDKVATIADMDAKDIRFGCSVCPSTLKDGESSWCKVGYKWREFVTHCAAKSHAPATALVVLSPEEVAIIKEQEMKDPRLSQELWTCGHCAAHLNNLQKREIVIEHLKLTHSTDSPREPEDLFLFERHRPKDIFEATYPAPPPVPLPVIPHARAKGRHCVCCGGGTREERNRTFNLRGVLSHLAEKHDITDPIENFHYR